MFVLINIRSTDRRKNIFPLGLAYIAACFEKYEKVKVFDLHYKNNMDELYSLMTMETVKFVGFSVCSSAESMYNCASIAKSIKRISPATIIGIGGPHPTYQGREIMARHLEEQVFCWWETLLTCSMSLLLYCIGFAESARKKMISMNVFKAG